MTLPGRVGRFGRRSTVPPWSSPLPWGRGVDRIAAAGADAAGWSAEDYRGEGGVTAALDDPWMPAGVRASACESAVSDLSALPPVAVMSLEIGGSPAPLGQNSPAFEDFGAIETTATAHVAVVWRELELDLPFYDPSATAAPSVAETFTAPHRPQAGTRAGLLARATAIPHAHGRELAARAFAAALEEARWPNFFLSWLRLAPSVECPRVIALALELKEQWDDSPHLWRFRDASGRPSRQHERARGQLSWRRAVAMAEARTHEPAWHLLDDDLAAAWEDLGEPCPGFWSLAEWLEVMCCGDEAEVHALDRVAAAGRGRRALHLQDLCERLGLARTGAAGGSGRIPMVDQDLSNFAFRDGHFRLGAGAHAIERRAPTAEEMRARDDE